MAQRKEQTKERILRIAAELFARNGYHATGMAELGEAVGFGRGALYYHIGSKEDLLFEISGRHVGEMVAFGESVLSEDISPDEKFRRLSRQLMRTIADNLPELTVFFREVHSLTGERYENLLALRDRFESIWLEILNQGVDQGIFSKSDPLVVKGILGLHNYSYLWLEPKGESSPEEIADLFCDIALRGLLNPRARGGAALRPVT